MNNMKQFVQKFKSLKGAKFISVNNYLSSTSGELANHVINVNISVENAKKTDYERLKNCNDNDLKDISTISGIAIDILKQSLSELIASAEKNLSAKLEDRSAQSQGQTNAYINITPAIKLHLETMAIHVFGQAISKEVLIKGEYKSVNSSTKTIGKNAIKKHLDLRSDKFRNFILGNADTLKVSGQTIEIVR